eukprot:29021-Pelagococcus_subviridis.AAC.4
MPRAPRTAFGARRGVDTDTSQHDRAPRRTPSRAMSLGVRASRLLDVVASRASSSRAASSSSSSSRVPSASRDAAAASPSGRSSSSSRRRRRDRKVELVVRRGQFKNLDERPPWPITIEADVHSLGMDEHDELNPPRRRRRRGGGGARRSTDDDDDDDDDDDATEETGATFRATVAPVGHGFFIDGSVDAVIAVACEVCGAPTMQRVEGVDVKAWLDENANELDSSGETEVIPFPRHREECDLTGLIRDVVRMRAPYENVCEACERDGSTMGGG